MEKQFQRVSGRGYNQLRPLAISYNVFGYAAGSVLFELGNTKILCSVTLQTGVPPFLKGSKRGWLTAEYAMLPTSSQQRVAREGSTGKRNDRAIEISRLIGRCLRSVVDLSLLGERTIMVDCDVLEADGSTRTAAITGAFLALKLAQEHWMRTHQITASILKNELVAVSAGMLNQSILLDLDYSEDSIIDADYNFILTRDHKLIEIQGAAEKNAVSWDEFDKMKKVISAGVKDMFKAIDASWQTKYNATLAIEQSTKEYSHTPLFSLKNRLQSAI
ncbi:MAG: ribonuclease PH [Candidatus Babeliales bacterium]